MKYKAYMCSTTMAFGLWLGHANEAFGQAKACMDIANGRRPCNGLGNAKPLQLLQSPSQ